MAAKWTAFVAGDVLTAAQLNDVVDNFQDIAIFNETQSAATAGGTSTATTWTKRTLNTTIVNNLGATLSSSVITLPAGTYLIEASAPFYNPDGAKIKLRNTTDSTDAIVGQNNYINDTVGAQLVASLTGVVTIAASKNFELQYWVEVGAASQGLGISVSGAGVSAVYGIIKIVRIA